MASELRFSGPKPEPADWRSPVQLFVLRLLALGALVGLYLLSPFVGVASLAGGFGYVIGRRSAMGSEHSGH